MNRGTQIGILVVKSVVWTLRRIDHHVLGSSALRTDEVFRDNPYPSFEAIRHY